MAGAAVIYLGFLVIVSRRRALLDALDRPSGYETSDAGPADADPGPTAASDDLR
ncbi:MAG: hypothetical protein M5U31_01275 [Acidimicrobiia bacterium]|nr:hypothetical protein [Acidimicrobiia bacterium]